jgi:predicted acyltransferase
VLGDPTWSSRIRAVSLPWGGDPRIAFAVTFVLAWWLLAWLLHRRRIYIHA